MSASPQCQAYEGPLAWGVNWTFLQAAAPALRCCEYGVPSPAAALPLKVLFGFVIQKVAGVVSVLSPEFVCLRPELHVEGTWVQSTSPSRQACISCGR